MRDNSTDSDTSNMSAEKNGSKMKATPYIIIGPKGAGKTVFFVSAVDLLLRCIIEKKGKRPVKKVPDKKISKALKNITDVEYLNQKTADFIRKNIEGLEQQVWPAETVPSQVDNEHYEVQITQTFRIFFTRVRPLILLDFPGGAYTALFGNSEDLDPTHYRQYDGIGQQMENYLESALGIFVLLDCGDLYNGGSDVIAHCLHKLIDVIRSKKASNRKIAFLFTKGDLIVDPNFCPESKLKDCYPNEWGRLNSVGARFFKVSSVKATTMNKDGERIPVQGFNTSQSDGILEPLIWVLGI